MSDLIISLGFQLVGTLGITMFFYYIFYQFLGLAR